MCALVHREVKDRKLALTYIALRSTPRDSRLSNACTLSSKAGGSEKGSVGRRAWFDGAKRPRSH